MLTEEQAIAIALGAVTSTISPSSVLTVTRAEGCFVVTWKRPTSPGYRGPSYDAQLWIDQESGEIRKHLVAS